MAGNSSYLGSGSLINAAAVGFGGVSSTSSSFVEISNLKNINVKEAIARRNAEINEQTHRANLLSRTKTTSKTKLFDSNPTMNKTDSQKLSSNSLGDVSDTASIASTNSNFHNKFNTVPRPPSTDPSSESYRPRTVSADSYALVGLKEERNKKIFLIDTTFFLSDRPLTQIMVKK